MWRSAVDRVMAVGRVAYGGAKKFAARDTAGWSRTAIRPRSIQSIVVVPYVHHPFHPPTSGYRLWRRLELRLRLFSSSDSLATARVFVNSE